MHIGPLLRTAILVVDLDRSIAFYRGVLGLTEIYLSGQIDDPAIARLLGMNDLGSSRFTILKADGPAIGMIGLFEIPGTANSRSSTEIRAGQTCLVFNHPNLKELHAHLIDGGHTVVCPPTRLNVTGELVSLEMTFRDPDGVMINCIERDPGLPA